MPFFTVYVIYAEAVDKALRNKDIFLLIYRYVYALTYFIVLNAVFKLWFTFEESLAIDVFML